MEVRAKLSFVRVTPRKLRQLVGLCKGFSIDKAHCQLGFSKRKGGQILSKLVDSAVANAKEKGGIDVDNLYVKNVLVDDGPILKRVLPRSMGRADKILKKMSHVTVVLDEAR